VNQYTGTADDLSSSYERQQSSSVFCYRSY
jgi:hypothetical protein